MDSNELPIQERFSIGEAARILGVSVPTLRLYDRKGLLLVRKNPANHREYSPLDIERLKCIRMAITVMKISIEGIRRIQSLIPCWGVVNCPEEARLRCPAYTRPDAGCWTYKHRDNACSDRECITCPAYILSGDCLKIKALLQHHPELPTEYSLPRMEDGHA